MKWGAYWSPSLLFSPTGSLGSLWEDAEQLLAKGASFHLSSTWGGGEREQESPPRLGTTPAAEPPA